jgi:hypothetical protein
VQPSINAKASTTGTSVVQAECDQSLTSTTGVLPVKITDTMSPKQQKTASMSENLNNSLNNNEIETTDVTVVKEIRKEMMSNGPAPADQNQAHTAPLHSTASDMNEEIMKVDEETLYIVEKRKQPNSDSSLSSSSAPSSTSTSTTTTTTNALPSMSQTVSTNPLTAPTNTQSTHFVEKEIRKNFELKPKEKLEGSVAPQVESSKQKQQPQQQQQQQQQKQQSSSMSSNSANFYDEFNK